LIKAFSSNHVDHIKIRLSRENRVNKLPDLLREDLPHKNVKISSKFRSKMGFLNQLFSYGSPFTSTFPSVKPTIRASIPPQPTHHKVAIIGSGPAGHTAAIYLARANMSPVMYEGFMAAGVASGGQLTTTTEVENFPGFPEGLSGPELMDSMRKQSIKFGTEVITETISKVDFQTKPFRIWKEGSEDDKDAITADSVVVATGATAKRMFIEGEDVFWQAGISACAVCDGAVPIFRNKPLAVVGGGDSACEEATFLTKYGEKVYMLVRRDKLRASKVMQERVMKHPKIEILWNKVCDLVDDLRFQSRLLVTSC
jgi:thioredoxin reductase